MPTTNRPSDPNGDPVSLANIQNAYEAMQAQTYTNGSIVSLPVDENNMPRAIQNLGNGQIVSATMAQHNIDRVKFTDTIKAIMKHGGMSTSSIAQLEDYLTHLEGDRSARFPYSISRGTIYIDGNTQLIVLPNGREFRNPEGDIEQLHLDEVECTSCEDWTDESEISDIRNSSDHVCNSCFSDSYFNCERCSNNYHADNQTDVEGESMCLNCAARMGSNMAWRRFVEGYEYLSSEIGEIIQSKRGFGVELETIHDDPSKACQGSQKVPKMIGIGKDGSINGANMGVEFATPVMSGKKAEEIMKDFCAVLAKYEYDVNQSCGYHVHIDLREIDSMPANLQFECIKDVWLFYIAYEDVLLSFLPKSRRVNARYCAPLKADYHFKEIYQTENIDQLERIWYRVQNKGQASTAKGQKKHDSRYKGINMHTLFSERHLEIRYHSGTINRRKILEWANLHIRIMDKALVRNSIDRNGMNEVSRSIDMADKTNRMFTVLGLKKSSEDYFRARQAHFAEQETKAKPIGKTTQAETKKLLSDEAEN